MRAAAVALVLIVGAVVVLLFANTLNSWVMGGLIGGLAALLISIPISLTLFFHLSHRHDEQLKAQAQEARSLAQTHQYLETPMKVYEANAYRLSAKQQDEWAKEEIERRTASTGRNLPVPSYTRLPAERQHQVPATSEFAVRQRSTGPAPVSRQQAMPVHRERGAVPHRPTPQRQYYPGGYQQNVRRSQNQHQTAALRAARQEAVQQQHSDREVVPTHPSKRLPVVRPIQDVVEQRAHPKEQRASHSLPQQTGNHYRPRPTVDGTSVPPRASRPLSGLSESSSRQSFQIQGPDTEKILDRYPQTGPVRQQGQTGQTRRNPHVEEQRRNPDHISGSLKNPLLRRAPYMYEDDPLRQQLAQQIDAPAVRRRSSRYEDEDE